MFVKTTILVILLNFLLIIQCRPQHFPTLRRSKSANLANNPFLQQQNNNNFIQNEAVPKPEALNVQELLQNPFFIEFFNEYQKQHSQVSGKQCKKNSICLFQFLLLI